MSSIRDAVLLRTLAECRHFGRTATALGVAQPAVSKALAQIEGEIGETLFERSTMKPAEIGRIVLRHCDILLGCIDELERDIRLHKGLEIGGISIAMGPYPASISGVEAVARYSSQYPKHSVDFRVTSWIDAVDAVAEGRVDIAVADVREAEERADLEIRPVRQQFLTFICRAEHPLAGKPGLEFKSLLEFPWVGPVVPGLIGKSLPHGDFPFGTFDSLRSRFRPRIVVETFSDSKSMIMNSNALTAALPVQIKKELAAGTIKLLLEAPFELNYGFILRRYNAVPAAVARFMQLFLDVESEQNTPDKADVQAS